LIEETEDCAFSLRGADANQEVSAITVKSPTGITT
jgi:hypothetical protein